MLAYFPTIYPGELLYSVLARYHRHTGGESPSRTNEALFGERHVMASPDFPGHLAALAARIPKKRGLTVETLIDRTTLYPYYTAFEPPAVRARAREAMTVGSTEGLHLALGLATFRAGRVTTLRFCPACQQSMLTEVGELYWRRDQQLPGVLVCPEHGTPLFESRVSLAACNRHVFIAADQANCPRDPRPLMARFDERTRERLQSIARRSAAVLEGAIEPRTFAGWSTYYRAWMMRVGLARSPHKLDQRQLETEFRAYYGAALQVLPSVMDDGRLRGEWLAAMVRKHRHAMQPLYHLLLQDFLTAREPVDRLWGVTPGSRCNPSGRRQNNGRSKRPMPAASRTRRSEQSAHSPRPHPGSDALRDWPAIDADWADRIRRTSFEIRALCPPVRVSPAEIERRIGTRGWLSKRQEKLPGSTRTLTEVTESIAEFQQRRIVWAIAALEAEGAPAVPWRVLRKAGLRSIHHCRVETVLARHIGHRRHAA